MTTPDTFFLQPPDAIWLALNRPPRELVSDAQVDAFRRWPEVGLPLPSHSLASPSRNVLAVDREYRATQDAFRRIVRTWRSRLPSRADRVAARQGAEPELAQALRTAFPAMAEEDLAVLAAGVVRAEGSESLERARPDRGRRARGEKWSLERARVLGDYVGHHLRPAVGARTVRDACLQARRTRARWGPFLAWVRTTHPARAQEYVDLAEWLEWCRADTAGPVPADYYATFGPMLLDLLRHVVLFGPPHPRATAVGTWLRSLTNADVEQWPEEDWRRPRESAPSRPSSH